MQNHANDKIVVDLLKTKDSMETVQRFPSSSMKRAHSMDEAAKTKIAELKSRSKSYQQLEKAHDLKSGNPGAAGELLTSLLKPRHAKAAFGWNSAAKPETAEAFCGNCGTNLTPGAAFCANCGSRAK